ncbi:MAG TPA: AAA family ATPase [Acidimicrobiales bacterium]|nr:AAA family ATPase [Acidimicrobiales bacterium]
MAPPPHDLEAERAVLGAMMLSRDAVASAMALCERGDFYKPDHGNIFETITRLHGRGDPVEARIVSHELVRAGVPVPPADLNELVADAPPTSTTAKFAGIVAGVAARRRADAIGFDLRQAAADGDIDAAMLDAIAQLDGLRRTVAGITIPPTLREFLAEDLTRRGYLIPDLLEPGDRVIFTGPEGGGKSTLLRQIAVLCAGGIHPFTFEAMDPIRTLTVDAENPKALGQRKLAEIRACMAGDSPADENLLVEFTSDIDLLDAKSAARFEALVDAAEPQLLVLGPSYKLSGGDPNEEATARSVVAVLDRLRARHGCAVVLESHTPHGTEERPYGASLWRRWPEFGLFLAPTGALRHWRGQRDERDWPTALQRGGEFPWTPTEIHRDTTPWNGPTHCADAILELLNETPGAECSVNTLTDSLKARGQSYRKNTVSVAAETLVNAGRIRVRSGPRNSRMYRAEGTDNDQVF